MSDALRRAAVRDIVAKHTALLRAKGLIPQKPDVSRETRYCRNPKCENPERPLPPHLKDTCSGACYSAVTEPAG